ncbi:MAG: hypothetical protein HON07_06625 [Planctomycetaceae bacterium]|jgi:hypothetical protein|nr:hypothetical protein [Planctomycetaceae bacterium]
MVDISNKFEAYLDEEDIPYDKVSLGEQDAYSNFVISFRIEGVDWEFRMGVHDALNHTIARTVLPMKVPGYRRAPVAEYIQRQNSEIFENNVVNYGIGIGICSFGINLADGELSFQMSNFSRLVGADTKWADEFLDVHFQSFIEYATGLIELAFSGQDPSPMIEEAFGPPTVS